MANIIIDIVFVSFIVQTIYYYVRRNGNKKEFPLSKKQTNYIKTGYLLLFLYLVMMFVEYITGNWLVIIVTIPILIYFFFIWNRLYSSPLMLIINKFKFSDRK